VARGAAAQRGAQPALESWTTPAPPIPANPDGERAARGRA